MVEPATVLTVDDEPAVIELISTFLEDDYEVMTATSGEEALRMMDESIDVVLLDRLMSDVNGDEVLEEIRNREYDCGVVMVSAVEPDVDIATLQYNEYLVKPISSEELHNAIERTLALSERDIQVQEYFALADKVHALRNRPADETAPDVLDDLEARMDTLSQRIDPPLTDLERQIADRLARKWPGGNKPIPTED